MHDIDRSRIRVYVDHLIAEKYLTLSGEEYQVLRLTERAGEVLFHGERVTLTERIAQQEKNRSGSRKRKKEAQDTDDTLLDALKVLRTKLAQKENVPAYIVFSNATLSDMASKQPGSMEEFFSVSGVGEVKAKRYGAAFLEAIEDWLKANKHNK
jgi:ATP-dependent DNA helicase RecQ